MFGAMTFALVLSLSGSELDVAPPRKLKTVTFVDEAFTRVQSSMLQFRPEPSLFPARDSDIIDRQRMRQWGGAADMMGSQALGGAVFGAMSALLVHAPKEMRVIFDNDYRLAPALLPDGGLGAGFGARF